MRRDTTLSLGIPFVFSSMHCIFLNCSFSVCIFFMMIQMRAKDDKDETKMGIYEGCLIYELTN